MGPTRTEGSLDRNTKGQIERCREACRYPDPEDGMSGEVLELASAIVIILRFVIHRPLPILWFSVIRTIEIDQCNSEASLIGGPKKRHGRKSRRIRYSDYEIYG